MEEMERVDEGCNSPQGKEPILMKKPGIIYLSRIPPHMKPLKVRAMFGQFGEVGRIYLQPEDQKVRERRKKHGGSVRKSFTEGWVEFKDKKTAKMVAISLNNSPIGGKKRGYYCEDIWNIKYLPKFKWSHISEKLAYEKASRGQRMRTEMAQARKEATVYMENVAKSKGLKAMEAKKRRKGKISENSGNSQVSEDIEKVMTKYRQKEVLPDTVQSVLHTGAQPSGIKRKQLDPGLLSKVFGSK